MIVDLSDENEDDSDSIRVTSKGDSNDFDERSFDFHLVISWAFQLSLI
jgi:hypothetical protein